MGKANFSDDFKRDAVHQITVWDFAVRKVSPQLGVSKHSLYQWMKKFSAKGNLDTDHPAENCLLKRELAQVREERDILKKAPRTSPKMQI